MMLFLNIIEDTNLTEVEISYVVLVISFNNSHRVVISIPLKYLSKIGNRLVGFCGLDSMVVEKDNEFSYLVD